MAQQGPNPIEVYQGVAQSIVSTFGNVNASQLSASTPCVEWTVQKLINHNINVQTFLHATLTGQTMDPGSMFQVDGPIPQKGAEAALKSITDTVISAAQGMDLSTVVTTPFGEMPAGHFMMIPILDLVVHQWDVASATNQNKAMDSAVAEICLGVLSPEAVEGGRKMGAFGPEVVIPSTGSAQDKLLGLTGRTP